MFILQHTGLKTTCRVQHQWDSSVGLHVKVNHLFIIELTAPYFEIRSFNFNFYYFILPGVTGLLEPFPAYVGKRQGTPPTGSKTPKL